MSRSRNLRQQLNSHMAARIRERRIQVGLPQRELAQVLGISQQAMSKLEAGKMTIAADTLWLISVALDTTIDFYFEGIAKSEPAGEAEPAHADR